MRLLIYLFVGVFVCSVALGDIIKNGSLKANSDGANVILEWTTEDESNVTRFEVERRMGTDENFLSIASMDAKGASVYQFVDYSVFRKSLTIYQYRIKIVFTGNGGSTYVGPVTVSHTVSGVRRTWGSIKAMFR